MREFLFYITLRLGTPFSTIIKATDEVGAWKELSKDLFDCSYASDIQSIKLL